MTSKANFNWQDPFLLNEQLTEEEKMVRDATRRYCQENLMPRVLDVRDPAVSVAAVFSWSYRQLDSDVARMFRLLGLHSGPDISVPAAANRHVFKASATRESSPPEATCASGRTGCPGFAEKSNRTRS